MIDADPPSLVLRPTFERDLAAFWAYTMTLQHLRTCNVAGADPGENLDMAARRQVADPNTPVTLADANGPLTWALFGVGPGFAISVACLSAVHCLLVANLSHRQ